MKCDSYQLPKISKRVTEQGAPFFTDKDELTFSTQKFQTSGRKNKKQNEHFVRRDGRSLTSLYELDSCRTQHIL